MLGFKFIIVGLFREIARSLYGFMPCHSLQAKSLPFPCLPLPELIPPMQCCMQNITDGNDRILFRPLDSESDWITRRRSLRRRPRYRPPHHAALVLALLLRPDSY